MKRKRVKAFIATAIAATTVLGFSACGGNMAYNDYLDASDGYDKELFYCNSDAIQAADPCVITVGDTFYLYATNANASGDCSYICSWRSKNLSDWEALGPVFTPQRDAWSVSSLWAPEVIEKDGTYYMYYSGFDINDKEMGIGVATATSPAGPYKELEGTFNGKTYTHTEKPFDFGYAAIDANPFIDDNGDVYLYFSRDQYNKESSVFGCKLKDDMVTVEEGTLTETAIVKPSQTWESYTSANKWNEAPYVFKHNGKYVLMYSANYYKNSSYSVGIAVSDKPLSGFEKVDYNPVLHASADWTFVSGTGHNSIFPSPDGTELWIAYHSHIDVESGGDQRKINFDKVVFDDAGRMLVNGPSTTVQALPSGCSQYKNIAPLAEVSEGDGLLTDGIVNWKYDGVETYEYAIGDKTEITFTFSEEVTVKAVMIYDSADYALSAETLDIDFGENKIKDLAFNSKNRYMDEFDYEVKMPGSAAIAEFEEISTKKITFTFKGDISLNEIVILGKGGNI